MIPRTEATRHSDWFVGRWWIFAVIGVGHLLGAVTLLYCLVYGVEVMDRNAHAPATPARIATFAAMFACSGGLMTVFSLWLRALHRRRA